MRSRRGSHRCAASCAHSDPSEPRQPRTERAPSGRPITCSEPAVPTHAPAVLTADGAPICGTRVGTEAGTWWQRQELRQWAYRARTRACVFRVTREQGISRRLLYGVKCDFCAGRASSTSGDRPDWTLACGWRFDRRRCEARSLLTTMSSRKRQTCLEDMLEWAAQTLAMWAPPLRSHDHLVPIITTARMKAIG